MHLPCGTRVTAFVTIPFSLGHELHVRMVRQLPIIFCLFHPAGRGRITGAPPAFLSSQRGTHISTCVSTTPVGGRAVDNRLIEGLGQILPTSDNHRCHSSRINI